MHCDRCIAVDCRGYGDTDKPSGKHAYDVDVLADDIANLAKALKCDSFTLVGHGWGGMVGYQVCLRSGSYHLYLYTLQMRSKIIGKRLSENAPVRTAKLQGNIGIPISNNFAHLSIFRNGPLRLKVY